MLLKLKTLAYTSLARLDLTDADLAADSLIEATPVAVKPLPALRQVYLT